LEQLEGLSYPVSGISAWDRFSDNLDRPVVALGDAGIGGSVPGWHGPPPRASMCAQEQPPAGQLDAQGLQALLSTAEPLALLGRPTPRQRLDRLEAQAAFDCDHISSVIMTRGARHCRFSSLRSSRLAAFLSRRL
jgi:hypothetical protein